MRKRRHYGHAPPATVTSRTTQIKPGMILTDISGKKWRLGKIVGTGGFGEVYLASNNINHDVKTDSEYVAKIERYESGPLFVEINCYLRIAKPQFINNWKENNQIQHLGMPHYVASGSHKIGSAKYRFLVLPRFEKDLEQILKKQKFNLKTVLTIALQTVDVLEYIHSKGYIHSDIKAPNILFNENKTPIRLCRVRKFHRVVRPNLYFPTSSEVEGATEEVANVSKRVRANINKIYLLDYGLASKYVTSNGKHKQLCSDKRNAHGGTLLFCSRDAHEGAQSRRSDLECLGYNMIHWLTSNLPWSENTDDPEMVHQKKCECIKNAKKFLRSSFNPRWPKFLYDYFTYLKNLKFEEEPDYKYIKNLFQNALQECGYKNNMLLDFDNLAGWGGYKQKKFQVKCVAQKLKRSPLKSNLSVKRTLRSHIKSKKQKRKMDWSEILVDPEVIIKKAKSRGRRMTQTGGSNPPPNGTLNLDLSNLNPTTTMIDVFNKLMEKRNNGHYNTGGLLTRCRGDITLDNIDGYTPAMMQVYSRKKEREELEDEHQLFLNSKPVKINGKAKSKAIRTRKKRGKNRALKHETVDTLPCTRLSKSQSKKIP